MRPKTIYNAAFSRGRILPGSLLDTPAQVRRYVRAMYAQEVSLGLHDMRNVLTDHGITVEQVVVVKRVPARR